MDKPMIRYSSYGRIEKKALLDTALEFSLLICMIISGMALFHSDSTLSSPATRLCIAVILLTATLLAYCLIGLKRYYRLSLIIIIPIVYFLIYNLNNYTGTYLGIISLVELMVSFVVSNKTQANVFVLYKKFLLVISLIGILCYIMYVIHFPFPYSVENYYTSYAGFYYIDYKLSYLCTGGGLVRLCGLFNEPGYFGTILALVLCASDLRLTKKENLILFIAGILTFSLAFALIILIYLALVSYKRPRLMGVLLLIIIFLLFIAPNISTNNLVLQNMLERFTFQDGKWLGNNRSSGGVDNLVRKMFTSGENLLWGKGTGFKAEHYSGELTYKTYLIDYGVLGFLFMYASYAVFAIKRARGNKKIVFFIVAFLASIYQRPNIFNTLYAIILFGGIEYMKYMEQKEK